MILSSEAGAAVWFVSVSGYKEKKRGSALLRVQLDFSFDSGRLGQRSQLSQTRSRSRDLLHASGSRSWNDITETP
ncbi:hypothetical protein Hdeb2414_s0001g00025091 [Helianthus debilis subsp. tardiflorus]